MTTPVALAADNQTFWTALIQVLRRANIEPSIMRGLCRGTEVVKEEGVFAAEVLIKATPMKYPQRSACVRALRRENGVLSLANMHVNDLTQDSRELLDVSHDGWRVSLLIIAYTLHGEAVDPCELPEGSPLGRRVLMHIQPA